VETFSNKDVGKKDRPREVKERTALREMLSGSLRRERYYYGVVAFLSY
jgi:hypothetical protein